MVERQALQPYHEINLEDCDGHGGIKREMAVVIYIYIYSYDDEAPGRAPGCGWTMCGPLVRHTAVISIVVGYHPDDTEKEE